MSPASQSTVLPPGRFARRREHTKRELLAAAKRVFAARGYHQAKVSDIADEADVGVGTFYLHYDSKEAAFLELVEETARNLKACIDRTRAAVTNPAEQFASSCEVLFRFADDNRETFRILFGEGGFNQAITKAQQVFVADVTGIISAGIETGIFPSFPPDVIAHGVIGLLTQVVSWWITQDEVSLEAAVEATNRFVACGLVSRSNPQTTPDHS